MAIKTLAVRIATRGSALALAQAQEVLALCRAARPELTFELRILRTSGDRLQAASLAKLASGVSKGLFTKELELALLEGSADLAVHSLKDLPTSLPTGLRLAGILRRADVRDVLLTRARDRASFHAGPPVLRILPEGAVVATGSERRAAQLRRWRPDVRLTEIRGNVPTRLGKLAEAPGFAATILAAAGLARLGIRIDADGVVRCPEALRPAAWDGALRAARIPVGVMLPAVGQGAIGLECRSRDRRMAGLCVEIGDPATFACVLAERAFLAAFGGGCHSPAAALARLVGGRLRMEALVFSAEKSWCRKLACEVAEGVNLGRALGLEARAAIVG